MKRFYGLSVERTQYLEGRLAASQRRLQQFQAPSTPALVQALENARQAQLQATVADLHQQAAMQVLKPAA